MTHASLDPMVDAEPTEPERVRPLRRAEYDKLVELGAFEDERIELLRGVLVEMSPAGTRHAHGASWIADLMYRLLGERALVRCQCPFGASDDSEPEPDVAVVPRRVYLDDHPTSAHLIVEVAESSLRKDRGVKRELYAGAEVPEYWIVNLVHEVVEVHRAPVNGVYTESTRLGRGDRLRLVDFPDVEVAVADLLPPAH